MEQFNELDSDIDPFEGKNYPGAHSMDTTWFAVDKDGYIAVMESNEEGAVPMDLVDQQGEDGNEILKSMASSLSRKLEFNADRMSMPESIGLYSYWGVLSAPNSEAEIEEGENGESAAIGPYERQSIPQKPLHITEFTQEQIANLRLHKFENHSFAEDKFIQPALETECELWSTSKEILVYDEVGNKVKVPSNFRQGHQKTQEKPKQRESTLMQQIAGENLRKALDNLFGRNKDKP